MSDSMDEKQRIRRYAEQPGRHWRLLAQEETGPFQVENRGTLDEVVIDHWLHLEQMDDRLWWMRVGDARLMVSIGPAAEVQVEVDRGYYSEPLGTTTTHVLPKP